MKRTNDHRDFSHGFRISLSKSSGQRCHLRLPLFPGSILLQASNHLIASGTMTQGFFRICNNRNPDAVIPRTGLEGFSESRWQYSKDRVDVAVQRDLLADYVRISPIAFDPVAMT